MRSDLKQWMQEKRLEFLVWRYSIDREELPVSEELKKFYDRMAKYTEEDRTLRLFRSTTNRMHSINRARKTLGWSQSEEFYKGIVDRLTHLSKFESDYAIPVFDSREKTEMYHALEYASVALLSQSLAADAFHLQDQYWNTVIPDQNVVCSELLKSGFDVLESHLIYNTMQSIRDDWNSKQAQTIEEQTTGLLVRLSYYMPFYEGTNHLTTLPRDRVSQTFTQAAQLIEEYNFLSKNENSEILRNMRETLYRKTLDLLL